MVVQRPGQVRGGPDEREAEVPIGGIESEARHRQHRVGAAAGFLDPGDDVRAEGEERAAQHGAESLEVLGREADEVGEPVGHAAALRTMRARSSLWPWSQIARKAQ
ncbi:hypothetical protein GCM10007890_56680 [Methylobacterium tardum]|uniref:Uncharacterized protein n=1 Tax=Methylobacterium tardum TaxID=374432 RepID=A0AA37TSZ9_9HYPH|nr:hypothetical protein GCM10007890_56680 [Methylobacterium tardum]